MPSIDITQQAIVVEAPVDVSVVEFTSAGVTVEVPSTTLVLEFGTAGVLVPGSGLTGGGILTGNVPIGLSPATVASLLKADTAVQPGTNLSAFVDDVGYATDAEVFALLGGLGGAYQPLNEQLTSISGLATTVFGRSFLTLANETAARTLIGVYSTSEVLSLLAAKANVSHTHTTADITGGISWSNLTGIPLTFPPGVHTHVKADVTDFTHTHLLADVTDYVAPVLAHSGLTGLAADDHTQYHTDARGDARYSLLAHTHDTRYYTESEIDALLAGLAVSGHTHSYLPLAGGEVTGLLTVTVGAQTLALKAGPTLDHVFISFYADSAAQSTRSAYMGFGTAGQTAFKLTNEMTGGNIQFSTTGGGQVTVNGTAVSLSGHTHNYLPSTYLSALTVLDANDGNNAYGLQANYLNTGSANMPSGTDHALLTLSYNTNWSFQLAGDWRTNTLYTRKKENGVWGAWAALAQAGGSYLPLTGGELTGTSGIKNHTDTTWNRHLELTQVEGTVARPIQVMFHQENRWYLRIKAEGTGFSFIQGGSDDYVNIAAAIVTGTTVQTANFLSPLGYGGANTANSFYNDGYGTMKFGQASTAATNVPEAPDNANFMISYESHAGGYGRQMYYPDNENMWTRLHQSGTWGTWHKIARHVGSGYLLANTYDVWSASGWARALSLRTGASSAIQFYDATRHWGIGASSGVLYFMHTTSDTDAAPGMTYSMYNDGSAWYMTGPVVIAGPASIADGYGLYLNGSYGSCFIASHSDQTYGSIRIGGSKNGYSGIRFDDAYQDNQIMLSNSSNEFGLYSISGGWKFYYTGTTFQVQGSAYKPMPWHDMGGTAASARYSRGTGTPTGGSDGDVYFQYV